MDKLNEFLASIGITCTAVQYAFAKPGSADQSKFMCTVSYNIFGVTKSAEFAYSCGSAFSQWRNGEFGFRCSEWQANCHFTKPTAGDIVNCVLLDSAAADMAFDHWCDEFGADNDSIKALETYNACRTNARKFASLKIPADKIENIRELSQGL